MKSDEQVQKNVEEAIKREALLDKKEIGVIVNDGVVTLTGTVNNYAKKIEVAVAARNVEGVKVVIEEIKIEFNNDSQGFADDKIQR